MKLSSTYQIKIHNGWHPIKDYQTCKEARKLCGEKIPGRSLAVSLKEETELKDQGNQRILQNRVLERRKLHRNRTLGVFRGFREY